MISIDQSISPFPVHGHESIDSDGKRKGEKGRGRFEKGREGVCGRYRRGYQAAACLAVIGYEIGQNDDGSSLITVSLRP